MRGFRFDPYKFNLELDRNGISRKEVAHQLGYSESTGVTTISKWLSGAREIREYTLEKLESIIGVDRTRFQLIEEVEDDGEKNLLVAREEAEQQDKHSRGEFMPHDLLNYVMDVSGIADLYEGLAEGDVVSIISADGFLENSDDDLLYQMYSLIEKKVTIQYFYKGTDVFSVDDFYRLYRKFHDEYPNRARKYVHGYQMGLSADAFIGYKTRCVVIGKIAFEDQHNTFRKHRNSPIEGYVYADAGAENGDSSIPLWIRMRKVSTREYYKALLRNAEPVRSLSDYGENELDKEIQEMYASESRWAGDDGAYGRLRHGISSRSCANQVAKKLFANLADIANGNNNTLRYLDIGSGDCALTLEFHNVLNERIKNIQTNCIEPLDIVGAHAPKSNGELMDFINKTATVIHGTFEGFDPRQSQYDVITAFHSFYMIPRGYIKKVYSLLSPEGIAVIVLSPRDQNVVNAICRTVDDFFSKSGYGRESEKKMFKGLREFRNYFDDIHEFCNELFGCSSDPSKCVEVIKMTPEAIPFSKFFDAHTDGEDYSLNDGCAELLELFSHNKIKFEDGHTREMDIEDRLKEVLSDMEGFKIGGNLPAETRAIIIRKKNHKQLLPIFN